MSSPSMNKADFISSIVLTLFGVGVLVESLRLPRLENLNVNAYTVPGIVPGFLGLFLTLAGLFILIRSIKRGGYKMSLNKEQAVGWLGSAMVKRTAITIAITLAYAILLFPHVPFWLATPIFIFVFVVATEAMKYGRLPAPVRLLTALVLAVVAGLVINYVFQDLFFVRLPGG
ncbi:tripartite tricarboxylate transporter TctB family protein [uncultured Sneathiella sp.]|uniref:tripartite tricarboxylate transporter TctB family protein n=1 Tax=uncultured Sneathiella sp. TaxID=879315 RepID=UPI0030DAC10C|tara:strand:+ start:555 stop:1073 length:519 start_codon:yes stop_codon:yes gene_type:complete